MGIHSCLHCPNFSKHYPSIFYESINRAEEALDFFVALARPVFAKKLLLYSWLLLLILFAKEVSAQNIDFTLYAIDNTTDELITLDPSTGQAVIVGQIGFSDVNGLAYDSSTDMLYGVDNATGQLIEIDTTTGQGTAVGLIGLGGMESDPGYLGILVTDLTFGPGNTLFALTNAASSTSRLITIDSVTGAGTLISALISQQLDGLAYQPRTGKMYTSFKFTFIGSLFEIDPTNGVLADLGPVGIQIYRLSADPNAEKLFGLLSTAFPGSTELWSIDLNTLTKTQVGFINSAQASISGIETVITQAVEGPPGDPTCSDGIDNDVDGGIDLDDSDCQEFSICSPPLDLFADNTRAGGLTQGIISNYGLNHGILEGDVQIDNFTRFWLGVREIRVNPDVSGGLVLNEVADMNIVISPCQGGFSMNFPFIQCEEPGNVTGIVSFCFPGAIEVELGVTSLSASLTILDAIFPFAPLATLVGLSSELNEVPLWVEANECLMDEGGFSPSPNVQQAIRKWRCAARALVRLGRDPDQRTQMQEILQNFGINLGIRALFLRLVGGSIGLLQLVGDEIVFSIQSSGGVLTIEFTGD